MRKIKLLLENIVHTLISFVRLIIHVNLKYRFELCERQMKSLCIIGNGPSFRNTFHDAAFSNFAESKDFFCVNTFALSEEFDILKPRYYLFLDPEFWENTATDECKQLRQNLLSEINEKTTWNMTIFLPVKAKRFSFVQLFCFKENINIEFFNDCPFWGFNFIKFYLYRKGVAMPLGQNVLIGAVFLGLNMGYKNMYLIGADMSLHKNLILRDDNVVCGVVKRFYEDENEDSIKMTPFLKQGADPYWKMADLFEAFTNTFRAFDELACYAQSINAKVFNASKVTFIDSFKRCNIKNI